MKSKFILPLFTYHIMTDFGGRVGVGNGGDFTESQDDCADQAVEAEAADQPWRAFRMELCPDTNTLIGCAEVTGDILDLIASRVERAA